jgi:RNA polymerase sigma-70 factor (ECF subfamily)
MNTTNLLKDQQEVLIRRCQEGDRRAFVELVKGYQNMVFAVLYRMVQDKQEIEDVAQDVWVKVYQSIHKLKTPAAFRSWLHRIVLNAFRDRMRQKGNHIAFSLDDDYKTDEGDSIRVEMEAPGLLPEEELLRVEWQEHLEQAIRDLPHSHRAVIIMREIQSMSYEEIAFALDISLGTVKSRIARAREKLIATLSGYLKENPGKETAS